VLTLFPGMVRGPLDESIVGRARNAGLLEVNVVDFRAYARDRHHTADDAPFGGGAGMVLKPEPIVEAVEHVIAAARHDGIDESVIIMTAAQGRRFTQPVAERLAAKPHVVIVCGHYEGIDARVTDCLGAEEISIGDYVLTGGEIPALAIVDAVGRLVPGVLGASESLAEESIGSGLLEYPHYTRPAVFRAFPVPPVLLSGDHAAIAAWRRGESLRRTFRERPDLLPRAKLGRIDAGALTSLVSLPAGNFDDSAAGTVR